ncbi:MAG: hypothetical protein NC038_02400 [Paludibacter sp.]|nr:hypothetical protein [Bacteroidales bacterium]MCM1068526.1 hypothetical protein [Prevotella sp.]MCM1353480.1 hypothetical protein [Bacteroides sp.]MCM1442641.1 hypothetical protein [Muribaculum sp.]MCM1481486.1 hypothetical protein [Paludibacter sp.]
MKNFLRHITEHNLSLLIIFAAGCICMWIIDFLHSSDISVGIVTGSALLTLLNALLLMVITWRTGITRTRSGLPIVLYCLSVSSIPALHTDWQSQLTTAVFQFVLLLILSTYHKDHAVEESFLSTLLLCMGAMIMPDMLWFIPIVWLLFIVQRAFTLRTWLASLTGGILVAIYATLLHCMGLIRIGTPQELFLRQSIAEWNTKEWITAILITIEGIFFIVCILMRITQENHNIRSYITCLSIPFIPASILLFFPPVYFPSTQALSAFLLSGLCTWYFQSRKSIFSGIVFIVHIILWTGIYINQFV